MSSAMTKKAKTWGAVIVAGGSGTRMGSNVNKVLMTFSDGECALEKSLKALAPFTDTIVVVARVNDLIQVKQIIESMHISAKIVVGGKTRQQSVYNGLLAVDENTDYVMIHDAARCMVDAETIQRVKKSTEQFGSSIAGIPLTDTIKEVSSASQKIIVQSTPDRNRYYSVQTPQGFCLDTIKKAHKAAAEEGFSGTDDASLAEHMGDTVYIVQGSPDNIKLTSREDLITMESMLKNNQASNQLAKLRIGHGYDVHQLVEKRKLILCGKEIPYEKGLMGHSDADVAIHALMDAMLGAMALGDIGQHFPDNDPQYAGISSVLLLKKTAEILETHHAHVVNADITIIAQQPKLAEYIPEMRKNVSEALSTAENTISVKATTTEHLSFEGRGEGISAHAVVLVQTD